MANTNIEVLQKELRNLIAEIVEVEPKEITLDASFVEDLNIDSMMALEILAATEKKYNLKIPEENLTKITSLKQVVGLVNQYLK